MDGPSPRVETCMLAGPWVTVMGWMVVMVVRLSVVGCIDNYIEKHEPARRTGRDRSGLVALFDALEVLLHAQERATGGRQVALGDALLERGNQRSSSLERRWFDALRRGGGVYPSTSRVVGIGAAGDEAI